MDWSIVSLALPVLDSLPGVRAVLGFIIVFLLPGFAWTLVFFRQLSVLERLVLSFALSMALVTLSVIALNILLKVSINGLYALLIIFVITIIPLALYYLKKRSPES